MQPRLICPLVCLALAGCADFISIRSSWYVVEENEKPVTYIALLNQGNVPVTPRRIILNPIRDEISFKDVQHGGWEYASGTFPPLAPGRMLLTKASAYRNPQGAEWGSCQIVLEIDVEVAEQKSLVVSDMHVAMPSSIPVHWEADCVHPPPAAERAANR